MRALVLVSRSAVTNARLHNAAFLVKHPSMDVVYASTERCAARGGGAAVFFLVEKSSKRRNNCQVCFGARFRTSRGCSSLPLTRCAPLY